MKTAGQRILGLLTALLVTVGVLAPTMVAAADVEIQTTLPGITIGTDSAAPTTVGFAGSQWVVIGYNGNGVNSEAGTMTLLLASGNSLGTSQFNPNTNAINEYNGSTLQAAINGIAGGIGAGEQRLIQPRTLEGGSENYDPYNPDNGYDPNKIKGADVTGAMLWPLSAGEAESLENAVRIYNNGSNNTDWWLRSPGDIEFNAALVLNFGAVDSSSPSVIVSDALAVRPAFTINLESVLFTSSAAAGSGKSNAAVDGGLQPAQPVGTNLKFTVLNPDMPTPGVTLDEASEGASTLQFDFSGAATGGSQFVSAVVTASGSDDVLYYTKLANCDTNPDGTFSVDVSSDADGNPLPAGSYTLRVFSEQVNGDNNTDFASASQDIPFTVAANGTATVPVAVPNITTDPVGATYTEGDTSVTDLTVAATISDNGTLTYQWYENSTDSNTGGDEIAGATTAAYTPPADNAAVGTTYYYAVATNTVAGKTASTPSNTAKVEVLELFDAKTPTIDTQPEISTTCYVDDTDVELEVEARATDGGNLTYQWYSAIDQNTNTGGTPLPGEESATFALPTDTAGTYYYYVEITNTNTSATGNTTASINSNVATVHVLHYLRLDAIAAQTATVRQGYSFTPGHSYSGSGTLEFSLDAALPDGLTLDPGTGKISGIPDEGTERDYPLILTVTEQGGSLSASQPFTLTVQATPPQPPTATLALATPEDATIAVGSSYQKQLNATYTNGTGTLVYSATGLPAGISIDETTGLISGTPTTVGENKVTVTVAERNGGLEATVQFTITVVAAPKDPEPEKPDITLGGLPANNTVQVGDRFTLTPIEDKVNGGEADREGPLGGGQTGGTSWAWDDAYFSATFNSPATFTALKAGSSTITYTAPDGRTVSVAITIQAASETTKPTTSTPSSTPKDSAIAGTGDSSTVWLYAVLAAVAAALAGGLVWYKRRKIEQ